MGKIIKRSLIKKFLFFIIHHAQNYNYSLGMKEKYFKKSFLKYDYSVPIINRDANKDQLTQ